MPADTVRPAAQHHHFRPVVGRVGLALFFIGGVHVGGVGGEFRRAGIHALVHRMQAVAVAQLANFALGDAGQLGQTGIGEALAFQGAQERFVQAVDARFGHLFFRRTSSSICTRNQRSTLVRLKTPSTDRPARKASAMYQMRSEPASFSSRRILVSASGSSGLLSGRSRWHPLPDRAALFAATPAGCGRWPSLRRPTSSGWSGGRWRRRTSRS